LSEKELLYIEDALTQTKHMQTKCKNYAEQFQDRELKVFVKDLETRHQSIFSQIFKVLQ